MADGVFGSPRCACSLATHDRPVEWSDSLLPALVYNVPLGAVNKLWSGRAPAGERRRPVEPGRADRRHRWRGRCSASPRRWRGRHRLSRRPWSSSIAVRRNPNGKIRRLIAVDGDNRHSRPGAVLSGGSGSGDRLPAAPLAVFRFSASRAPSRRAASGTSARSGAV